MNYMTEQAERIAELESQVRDLTIAKIRAEESATSINSELFDAKKQISKAENLVRDLTGERDDPKRLQIRVDKGEVWYWQGDGYDFPESLTCPVIMQAETLRALRDNVERLEREAHAQLQNLENWETSYNTLYERTTMLERQLAGMREP